MYSYLKFHKIKQLHLSQNKLQLLHEYDTDYNYTMNIVQITNIITNIIWILYKLQLLY